MCWYIYATAESNRRLVNTKSFIFILLCPIYTCSQNEFIDRNRKDYIQKTLVIIISNSIFSSLNVRSRQELRYLFVFFFVFIILQGQSPILFVFLKGVLIRLHKVWSLLRNTSDTDFL